MIYLDSSYIFKCYTNEPGTREVLSLVQNSAGCGSDLHARAEFWSGLHRRVCETVTSVGEAQKIWRQFEQDERAGIWHWLPLSGLVVRRACETFEDCHRMYFSAQVTRFTSRARPKIDSPKYTAAIVYCWEATTYFGLKGKSVY
jgi:hypothetical protein